jgi:uncharacterized Zn finger protein (UPF0148 family)
MQILKHCPSCGSDKAIALKDGRIMCPACNVTFKIEEDGSSKPVDLDPLDKLHKKIMDEVDQKLTGQAQRAAAAGEETNQESDEEQDGFINWRPNGEEKEKD